MSSGLDAANINSRSTKSPFSLINTNLKSKLIGVSRAAISKKAKSANVAQSSGSEEGTVIKNMHTFDTSAKVTGKIKFEYAGGFLTKFESENEQRKQRYKSG